MWIVVLLLVLLFLGGVYFDHHSGWFNAKVYTPYASAEQLDAVSAQVRRGGDGGAGQTESTTPLCGICHGTDGMGKPNQAPPLAGSEWVNHQRIPSSRAHPAGRIEWADCRSDGKDWNLNMAPMGAALSDADLAAVLTYIRSSWGNKAGAVTADDVKAIRAAVGEHPAITGAELKNLPE